MQAWLRIPRLMLAAALICGIWASAQHTINGRLENGTSGGDGSAETVQLVKLDRTMEVVKVLENVTGSFSFVLDAPFEPGKFLVQARKGGAIYSQPVTDPHKQVDIEVYDTAADVALSAAIGSLALYAQGQTIDIGMFINVENRSDPPRTLSREGSTFEWPLLPGYRTLDVSTRRGNLPLTQSFTTQDGKAGIAYPMRPGRTQVMVRSRHAYNPDSEVNPYTLPLLPDQDVMHILVLPANLKLEGEGIVFVDTDKKEDVGLYEWKRPEGATELILNIKGKPMPQEPGAGEEQKTAAAADQPRNNNVKQVPNELDPYRWGIVAATLGLLAVFSFIGFRRV